MPKENNKMQVDIDTLKKQNVNDLLSIKELYKRIEELGEKTTQIKYIDNTLVRKIEKEYEKLKKIILDENIQVKITNDIETINSHLDSKATKDDIKSINSQLNTIITYKNLIKISDLSNGGNFTTYNKKITVKNESIHIKENVVCDNVYFVGNSSELTLNTTKEITVTFVNCVFENVSIQLYSKSNFKFINCTFEKTPFYAIELNVNDIKLEVDKCNFYNNSPNLELWNKNESMVRVWRFNTINIRCTSDVTIKNSEFKNLTVANVIWLESNHNDGTTKFNIINNIIDKIYGCGIGINSFSTGIIAENKVTNTGELKGKNEYDYDLTGVGCNGIYCSYDSTIDVKNNYFRNNAENGIEGIFNSIDGNYIENTGYRYFEGFTSPSTEGIYGGGTSITNNTIINPYKDGIILTKNITDVKSYGITISGNEINKKSIIIDNLIMGDGFKEKYCILKNDIEDFTGLTIKDIPNNKKVISNIFSNLVGVNFIGDLYNFVNYNFSEEDISKWLYSNSSLVRTIGDDGLAYGKLTGIGDNIYASLRQNFILDENPNVVTIEIVCKSTVPKVNAYVLSKKADDTAYGNDGIGVYTSYRVPFKVSTTEFNKHYITVSARYISEIGITITEPLQEIDIKSIRLFVTNNKL